MYEGKKDIAAPDYPEYWKRDIMDEVIDRCSPSDQGWDKVTVAQLRRARTLFEKDGVNPAAFLKTANSNAVFDVLKATKALVYVDDKSYEDNCLAVDALADTDGFSNYAKLAELQAELKKSIKLSLDRLAKGEGEEVEALADTTEDSLQQALDDEQSEIIVPDLFSGEVVGEGEEVKPMPLDKVAGVYTAASVHMITAALQLAEADVVSPDLDKAVAEMLASTLVLAMKRLDRDSVVAIFNAGAK